MDRRQFLQTATCAASATGLAGVGHAGLNTTSEVCEVETAVRPAADSIGAIVIPTGDSVCATFGATSFGHTGTALCRLNGCKKWRNVIGTNLTAQATDVQPDQLETCRVYEVKNSQWAREVEGRTTSLRHFVITFDGRANELSEGGAHFECLAEDIDIRLISNGSVATLVSRAERHGFVA